MRGHQDMIKEIECDIFKAPADILAQCCNPKGIWGGLAGKIKDKFPEVYEADQQEDPSTKKLGEVMFVRIKKPTDSIRYVANMYTQPNISCELRMTNYEAVARCFETLKNRITNKNLTVAFPYYLASDKGGADFSVIRALISSVFEDSTVNVLICRYPGFIPKRTKPLPFK